MRDLPTNLIASFRATLEEATHADALLIVLDVANPAAELQHGAVMQTLESLFEEVEAREKREGSAWRRPEILTLLNKVDRLADNRRVLEWTQRVPGAIPIVGRDPSHPGHGQLVAKVRELAQGGIEHVRLTVPMADGKTVHFIENRGTVLQRDYGASTVTLEVRIGRRQIDQLRSMGAAMTLEPVDNGASRAGRRSPTGRR
ncbi:hypothetical protein J4558_17165 [Leptolyngbya sp. 15MV]|nr:hypothetical protein J4558_17165 [Leptolyngbya sp. 15MV]